MSTLSSEKHMLLSKSNDTSRWLCVFFSCVRSWAPSLSPAGRHPLRFFDDTPPATEPATALHALHGLAHGQVIIHAPSDPGWWGPADLSVDRSIFLDHALPLTLHADALPSFLLGWSVGHTDWVHWVSFELTGHTARVCGCSVEFVTQVWPVEYPFWRRRASSNAMHQHHAPCTMHWRHCLTASRCLSCHALLSACMHPLACNFLYGTVCCMPSATHHIPGPPVRCTCVGVMKHCHGMTAHACA